MRILLIIFLLIPFSLFSKIPEKKLRILKNLDKHLSNGWTSYHNLQLFAEDLPNSYYMALYTKLTGKDGNNVGVSISIVEKKYKQKFMAIKPIRDGSIFEFIETTNYIIRINYCIRNCCLRNVQNAKKSI